ncbi:ABC transporter permease [Desertimonas flava]|uniref:ABC transporter permease n=1 Tax=Desertimonas flava TaxID=2064846 RepID=UPI0018781E1F|nr:ABC transporter permease [Desertimonas flava]
MRHIVVRRLITAPLVLVVASVLIFLLVHVAPGDPARAALGPYATAEQLSVWRGERGLDGSLLSRYGAWLGGVVRGNWGHSVMFGTEVRPLVLGRLGNSLLLGLAAFVLATPVAIGVGIWSGMRRGRLVDRAVSIAGLVLASTPAFVIGAILLMGFAVHLRWFPVNSQPPPGIVRGGRLRAMFLPALTVSLGLLGYVSRMARAGTIGVLDSAYYRAAELKGLATARLVRRHVLRNALVPTIAVLSTQLATMLGGLVVVEALFNYPGVGLLIVDAARDHDVTVLEAATLTTAAVSMLVLLVADLVYGGLDPRVRHGRA